MKNINLSIIIVNYNTECELCNCIDSFLNFNTVDFEVIIVDNSINLSQDFKAKYNTSKIKIINPGYNMGFGRANNLGVEYAVGEFILFLNPDCLVLEPQSLEDMIEVLTNDLNVGIVGGCVFDYHLVNEKMVITERSLAPQYCYSKYKKLDKQLFGKLAGNIAWVSGSVMMLRTKEFRLLGGFDPDFFLYAEESDLCLRYRERGFRIEVSWQAKFAHIGQASQSNLSRYDKTMLMRRGSLLFLHKHYPNEYVKRILLQEILFSSFKKIFYQIMYGISHNSKYDGKYQYCKAILDSAVKSYRSSEWLFFK